MKMRIRIVAILMASITLLSVLFFTTSVARAGSKSTDAQGNVVAIADIVQQKLNVDISGLAPYTVHALTLDQAKCGGTVLWSVKSVTADANGRINQSYLLPRNLVLPKSVLWVDVRQKNVTDSVTLTCKTASITTVAIATPTPTPQTSLPDTGVIPAKGANSYNNYTYPLKH